MKWKLKDKNGKFRSCYSFKQDMARDSQEPWELERKDKVPSVMKSAKKLKSKF